jgi:hypothetical protein
MEKDILEKVEQVLQEQWPAEKETGQGGRISIPAFRSYMKEKGVDVEKILNKK